MKLSISLILIIFSLFGCQSEKTNLNAQKIVDKAIEASGKERLKNAELRFYFRNNKYISEGTCGSFIFHRIQTDSTGTIKDVYNPKKNLNRYINDSLLTLPDTTENKYAESINSVMYFVQLPYRLNDNAVNKTYVGLDSINGKVYHKIAVNFDEEGGGTDFQDEYLYWFNTKNYELDYLAYSFTVNGGGIRFRKAINARTIDGIRFVDYENYKPDSKDIELDNLLTAFSNNKLELLSKIENKNVKVRLLDNSCL